ncbi:MAG TPA: hypothetical protein VGD06_07640 [Acidobacteriota bacterium]
MNDRHDQPNPRRDQRAASDQLRGDDDQLASRLRDADPAADEAVIAPAELAAMRRALIAAADAPASAKRWGLGKPRLRAALPVAAAVGAAALALWLLGPTVLAPVVPSPTGQQARSSDPVPDAITEVPGARTSGPARQPSADPSDAVLPETTVLPPAGAGDLTATETPSTDRKARTLQFTTPRGTRIIWTLDPEYVSPTAAPPARQE